jgi:hypothetical protein
VWRARASILILFFSSLSHCDFENARIVGISDNQIDVVQEYKTQEGEPSRTNFMRTVLFVVTWLAHATGYISGGFSTRYNHYNLSEKTKARLTLVQGFLSLVLALAITNNYVVEIPFFGEMFAENSLWIPATAFVLLIFFLIAIGSLITILTDRWRQQ